MWPVFAMRNRFASPDSQRKYLQFRLRSKDFRSPTPAFTILKIGEYRRAFALAARWRIVFLVYRACLREIEMQALVRRRTCPRGTRNEPCRMSSRTTLLGSMGIALTFSSRPHSETRLTRTSRQRFWKNGSGSAAQSRRACGSLGLQPRFQLEPVCFGWLSRHHSLHSTVAEAGADTIFRLQIHIFRMNGG